MFDQLAWRRAEQGALPTLHGSVAPLALQRAYSARKTSINVCWGPHPDSFGKDNVHGQAAGQANSNIQHQAVRWSTPKLTNPHLRCGLVQCVFPIAIGKTWVSTGAEPARVTAHRQGMADCGLLHEDTKQGTCRTYELRGAYGMQ